MGEYRGPGLESGATCIVEKAHGGWLVSHDEGATISRWPLEPDGGTWSGSGTVWANRPRVPVECVRFERMPGGGVRFERMEPGTLSRALIERGGDLWPL